MSDWINAVAESDLPAGSHTVVEVEGAEILLVNLDGEYYAIEDICTHDGGDLSTGCLVEGSMECPRHGARFDVKTGEVTAPPAYEAVDTFPVRVVDGVIQLKDDRWD